MKNSKNTNGYCTPKQLKLPIEIERIIEISAGLSNICHSNLDTSTLETPF